MGEDITKLKKNIEAIKAIMKGGKKDRSTKADKPKEVKSDSSTGGA